MESAAFGPISSSGMSEEPIPTLGQRRVTPSDVIRASTPIVLTTGLIAHPHTPRLLPLGLSASVRTRPGTGTPDVAEDELPGTAGICGCHIFSGGVSRLEGAIVDLRRSAGLRDRLHPLLADHSNRLPEQVAGPIAETECCRASWRGWRL